MSGYYCGEVSTTGKAGDADIAAVGGLLADERRCRILLALNDGRALPATRLASEAGVAASTASEHLAKLTEAGLLRVERHGRHRYYRLAGPHVGELLEALARMAPARQVRSLREGSRAEALRTARTCYDHLAGRLGVAVMASLLDRDHLRGGDGIFDPDRARTDRLSAPGHEVEYELTSTGRDFLDELGVRLPPRRRTVRYCVDWSEQRHHLAGGAGRGLRDRLLELNWIRSRPSSRAITVTNTGQEGLAEWFGIQWPQPGAGPVC